MAKQNKTKTPNKVTVQPVQEAKKNNNKMIGQIIGIGAVAGMRATFAPAVVSHYLNVHQNSNINDSKLSFVASPITSVVSKLLAAGEVTGDKLPSTPNRTAVPQIFGRIASGAFAGAVISKANDQGFLKGALIGGVSALAATFGAFYLRKYIDTIPGVKDVFTGAGEDIIALGSGILLMK